VNKFQGKPDVAFDICWKADGKLVWKCVGWRSEGMTAQEAADLRRESMKEARQRVDAAMTFGQAWEMYRRDWLEAENKACLATDISLFSLHLRRRLGGVPLSQIGPVELQAVMRDMADKSTQTRKHALGLVRRVFRKMLKWKLWRGDVPTDDMMPGKIDNERKRFLTKAEARMILSELDCRAPEFADVCRVSLYAGLRLGEIFALQVQHINLDSGLIDVMDAKAGSRQAFIGPALLPVLERHVRGRRASEWLFTQADGKSRMRTINQTFNRVLNDLELNEGITDRRQRVVFHTLRHTFASWLRQSGVPLDTVGDLLGHSTSAMTRRYAKLGNDDRLLAVSKLQELK
jgi:integrase